MPPDVSQQALYFTSELFLHLWS